MKIHKPFDTKNMRQNKLYFYFSDPAPKTDKAASCHRRKVALSVEVVLLLSVFIAVSSPSGFISTSLFQMAGRSDNVFIQLKIIHDVAIFVNDEVDQS